MQKYIICLLKNKAENQLRTSWKIDSIIIIAEKELKEGLIGVNERLKKSEFVND